MNERISHHSEALSIAVDHPSLAGHFPGLPIVPGVVLLDEALHAIERQQGADDASWHLSTIKFHHTVAPGAQLQLTVESQPDAQIHFQMRGTQGLMVSGTIKRRARIRAVASGR